MHRQIEAFRDGSVGRVNRAEDLTALRIAKQREDFEVGEVAVEFVTTRVSIAPSVRTSGEILEHDHAYLANITAAVEIDRCTVRIVPAIRRQNMRSLRDFFCRSNIAERHFRFEFRRAARNLGTGTAMSVPMNPAQSTRR